MAVNKKYKGPTFLTVSNVNCAINKFICNITSDSNKCGKEKINQGKERESARNGIAKSYL